MIAASSRGSASKGAVQRPNQSAPLIHLGSASPPLPPQSGRSSCRAGSGWGRWSVDGGRYHGARASRRRHRFLRPDPLLHLTEASV